MNNPMLTPEQNAKIKSITDQTMMLAALTGNDTPQVRAIVEAALTFAINRPDFTPKYGPVEICNYDLTKKESPQMTPCHHITCQHYATHELL